MNYMGKIRTATVFIFALCCACFPKRRVSVPNTIGIIQMAKLGDMVCTTPLFRAIKLNYPMGRLVVVGNAVNREVVAHNSFVDEYVSRASSLWIAVQQLRRENIDVMFITSPSFEHLAAALIARIPRVIVPRIRDGYSPYETLSYKLLGFFAIQFDHHMGSYAPQQYLNMLTTINIFSNDTKKDIYFTHQSKEHVETFLHTHEPSYKSFQNIIGILPGAGNEIKTWPQHHYTSLLNMIYCKQPSTLFILMGTKKDAELGEYIQRMSDEKLHIINAIDAFSLDELKACISLLDMVIGADTGPQYIAEALDIPTIDIVGPVDDREQPPHGTLHKIVKAPREHPELFVMNARKYNDIEARRQVNDITPEMVFIAYTELVDVLHKRESIH
jgi:heptosyltransferase II